MYDDIVLLFGEVIAAVLAVMILVFATLLCVARSRAHASEVHATSLVPSPTDSVLNLKNLSTELVTVINWFLLGINLGLPKHELSKIQQNYAHQGNDQQRVEMLYLWLQRTPNATWEDVVRALQQMGENVVAENIREKYIRRNPSILEDSGTAEIAQRNKQTIDAKFATLLKNVCNKLGGRKINMKDLRVFLKTFYPGECIPESSDIHDIFEALSSNKLWDSWNYLPIKKIVEGFAADDQEIDSWIEAYKQDLKSYKVSTRLIDHISVAESDSTVDEPEEQEHDKPARYDKKYYRTLSVKLKSRFTDQTMEYIDDLWHEIGDLYDLPHYLILLDSVRKGCVSIVWRIPSGIARKILEAAPPSDEFYHKHGVTRVEYGGEGIYQEGEFAISGPDLTSATTNQVSKFTVRTYGTHRRRRPVQQHVSAKLKSLVDGSVVQTKVVSQTPSTYELSYTPTTRGRHQLTVLVNNTEIGTFQVFVQHPPTQLDTPVRIIGGVGAYYIAVGDKGELFVTEYTHLKYTVLDVQGQTIGSVGKPFGNGNPTGIATDGEGNVYVASAGNKVKKFDRHGELVKSVGKWGRSAGEFGFPQGVRYHNHQVYVCDSSNARVQVFDSGLNFVRLFGPGQLKKPWDIDFDAQGNIYVVDGDKHQVLVFSEDGQYLRHFGQKGQGEGELSEPRGLCVSGDYVYVAEQSVGVLVFRTSGEFVYSFGKPGKNKRNTFYGIVVDQDGFVFVCDGYIKVF